MLNVISTVEWCVKAGDRRATLQPSLLPSVSDDRQELLRKTIERKLPWTDVETQYYDTVSLSIRYCPIIISYIVS